MRDHYEIETLEQLRAIADMLRIRIISVLTSRPMTATQLGDELGLAPAKVHYHVRELEKVGLLELVETREKGGILEKYYQPVAREITASKALFSSPSDEVETTLRDVLDQVGSDFLRAFRQHREQADPLMTIHLSHLYLTNEEYHHLMHQINALLAPFETPREIEGAQETQFSLLAYPPTEEKEEESAPQVSTNWAIGVLAYTRQDLLHARAQKQRLRINVIGSCQFARDIPASLVEETVESFSLTGALVASPEVKAVLKGKTKKASQTD